jgi:circadian clock protein KaiB
MSNTYVFTLFVTGHTPRSEQAIASARALCEGRLAGRAELRIVDVLDHPERAEEEKILATPTLVREVPPPRRRVIGALDDADEVLLRLGLEKSSENGGGREES